MGEDPLHGYRGEIRKVLEDAEISIGDFLRVERGVSVFEGTLMPRLESADERHLVLKMRTGYNIGVTWSEGTRISRFGRTEKPEFRPPPLPEIKTGLPRVSIVSTGGTIASRVDYITGGVQAAISSRDLLAVVPELADIAAVDADILYSIFSENIGSEHWINMARKVDEKVRKGSKGVIITHGTDTMAYSAAALSFALRSLPIPVIFVGSQRSSDRPSSDAATNLIGSVIAAVQAPFGEVVLGMHGDTSDDVIIFHKGTKVRKCHTSARYAFRSVNANPLARLVGGRLEMLESNFHARGEGNLKLMDCFEDKVALLKFHPDFNPDIIYWLLDDGYKGIILEGTGLGHVGSSCYEALDRAFKEGVYVGMTSQCIWGRIDMNVYTTGRELIQKGVEPLDDMLPETAFVKLMWCLGNAKVLDKVKLLMRTNISGEYTNRTLFEGWTIC